MLSELFRIPITWGGVPIFGVGVLLVAWLAFGAWGIWSTASEVGWRSALQSHLPVVLLVAAVIAIFIPRYFAEGVPIRGYGVMVVAGMVAGVALSIYRARQVGIDAEEIMNLGVRMVLCGAIGARLFYVIEYWDQKIRQDDWLSTLKAVLAFTEGGLVVYGAFIGAMAAFAWYVRQRGLPALAMADLIAPGMVAGLAFGRVGCLLNGCCYGGECTAAWAVTFPRLSAPDTPSPPYADQAASGRFHGFRIRAAGEQNSSVVITQVDPGSPAERAGMAVGDRVVAINDHSFADEDAASKLIFLALAEARPLKLQPAAGEAKTIPAIEPPARSLPVHPTQVYSALNAAFLAWLLWAFYPFRRRDGEATALMITLYPIARFLLEMIRVDEPEMFGTGLSISQNLSVMLLIGAVGMWIWLGRQPKVTAFFSAAKPFGANTGQPSAV